MSDVSSAIITGAASGIGAALVRKLARPDVSLTLHTRSSVDRLNAVAEEARACGAKVALAIGDLADAGVAQEIVAAHKTQFQHLQALIANAGFPLLTALDEMTAADADYAFRGNSQIFIALAQASLPLLRQSAQPRIVAVSSFTAHVFRTDLPQFPASAASKGAIEVLVRSLALALAKDGITVNCVVPGYIRKDEGTSDGVDETLLQEIQTRIPLARLGLAEEVANCIGFLISPEASYVTGHAMHVTGGLT